MYSLNYALYQLSVNGFLYQTEFINCFHTINRSKEIDIIFHLPIFIGQH